MGTTCKVLHERPSRLYIRSFDRGSNGQAEKDASSQTQQAVQKVSAPCLARLGGP